MFMTLHQMCCVLPSKQLSLNQSQYVKMSCFVFVANPCWYKSYTQRRGTRKWNTFGGCGLIGNAYCRLLVCSSNKAASHIKIVGNFERNSLIKSSAVGQVSKVFQWPMILPTGVVQRLEFATLVPCLWVLSLFWQAQIFRYQNCTPLVCTGTNTQDSQHLLFRIDLTCLRSLCTESDYFTTDTPVRVAQLSFWCFVHTDADRNMCTCISQASATLHAEHTSQFMLIMINNFKLSLQPVIQLVIVWNWCRTCFNLVHRAGTRKGTRKTSMVKCSRDPCHQPSSRLSSGNSNHIWSNWEYRLHGKHHVSSRPILQSQQIHLMSRKHDISQGRIVQIVSKVFCVHAVTTVLYKQCNSAFWRGHHQSLSKSGQLRNICHLEDYRMDNGNGQMPSRTTRWSIHDVTIRFGRVWLPMIELNAWPSLYLTPLATVFKVSADRWAVRHLRHAAQKMLSAIRYCSCWHCMVHLMEFCRVPDPAALNDQAVVDSSTQLPYASQVTLWEGSVA